MSNNEAEQNLGKGRFRRVKEDFVCYKCATKVSGSGYTDHCPNCLWGRHVDIMPGDRSSDCKGELEPIAAEYLHGSYTIIYRCKKCKEQKRFKAAEQDNLDILEQLASKGIYY